jgi:hypothetical protein
VSSGSAEKETVTLSMRIHTSIDKRVFWLSFPDSAIPGKSGEERSNRERERNDTQMASAAGPDMKNRTQPRLELKVNVKV